MGLLKKIGRGIRSVFKGNRAKKKKAKAAKLTAQSSTLEKEANRLGNLAFGGSSPTANTGTQPNMFDKLWGDIVGSANSDSIKDPLTPVQQAVFDESDTVNEMNVSNRDVNRAFAGFSMPSNPILKWGLIILAFFIGVKVFKKLFGGR